jgi:dTDP-4-dehydrorhamnose reductase
VKVVVTGVRGQLGYDVMNELAGRGYEGLGTDILPLDEKTEEPCMGIPTRSLI